MCHIEAKKVKNLQVGINAAVECFVCEICVIDYISIWLYILLRTTHTYIFDSWYTRVSREKFIYLFKNMHECLM